MDRALSRKRLFGTSLLALSLAAPSAAFAQVGPAASGAESAAQDNDAAAQPNATDVQPTAQDAARASAAGAEDAIVITGSRIARPELAFPNPVQSFTSAGIEQSGDTNLTDFLTDSPALVGSTTIR